MSLSQPHSSILPHTVYPTALGYAAISCLTRDWCRDDVGTTGAADSRFYLLEPLTLSIDCPPFPLLRRAHYLPERSWVARAGQLPKERGVPLVEMSGQWSQTKPLSAIRYLESGRTIFHTLCFQALFFQALFFQALCFETLCSDTSYFATMPIERGGSLETIRRPIGEQRRFGK